MAEIKKLVLIWPTLVTVFSQCVGLENVGHHTLLEKYLDRQVDFFSTFEGTIASTTKLLLPFFELRDGNNVTLLASYRKFLHQIRLAAKTLHEDADQFYYTYNFPKWNRTGHRLAELEGYYNFKEL